MSDSFSSLLNSDSKSQFNEQDGAVEIPELLRPFFSWCPTELVKAPRHSKSDGTRKASLYDQHLHEDLILKRIVHRPSITTDFAAFALSATREYITSHTTLPPPSLDTFPNIGGLIRLERSRRLADMLSEKSIGGLYQNHFSQYALLIAATIACRFDSWDSGHFTIEEESSCKTRVNGDLFLKLRESARDSKLTDEKGLRELFDVFRDICVLEFKSLQAAPEEKMRLVHELHLLDEFPWHGCPSHDCRGTHNTTTEGSRMGVNAPKACIKTEDAASCQRTVDACLPKPRHVVSADVTSSKITAPTEKDKENAELMMQQMWVNAVVIDATYVLLHAGNWEIYGIRDRESQTLYISDLIYVPKPGGENSSFGYGQLQVGFLIASIRDACDRASSMMKEIRAEAKRAKLQPKSFVMDRWDRVYDSTKPFTGDDLALQRQSARHPRQASTKPLTPQEQAAQQQGLLVRMSQNIRSVVVKKRTVHQHLPYPHERYMRCYWHNGGLSYCPVPESFDSSDLMDLSPASSVVFEKAKGATGLHTLSLRGADFPKKGTLFTGVGTDCNGKFIAKYALQDLVIRKVLQEFIVYDTFRRVNVMGKSHGLPELIGLFTQPPSQDHQQSHVIPPLLLLLEYVGAPFEAKEDVSQTIKSQYLAILDNIHYAGWLHGEFERRDLRMSEEGEPYIVGFSRAQPLSNNPSFAEEQKELERTDLSSLVGDLLTCRPRKRQALDSVISIPSRETLALLNDSDSDSGIATSCGGTFGVENRSYAFGDPLPDSSPMRLVTVTTAALQRFTADSSNAPTTNMEIQAQATTTSVVSPFVYQIPRVVSYAHEKLFKPEPKAKKVKTAKSTKKVAIGSLAPQMADLKKKKRTKTRTKAKAKGLSRQRSRSLSVVSAAEPSKRKRMEE